MTQLHQISVEEKKVLVPIPKALFFDEEGPPQLDNNQNVLVPIPKALFFDPLLQTVHIQDLRLSAYSKGIVL